LGDVPTQKATLTTPAGGFLIVGQTANSLDVAPQVMLRDMLLDERGDEIERDFALTAFLRRAVVASREAASADATRDHSVRDFRIRKALALMRSNMVRSLDLEAVARESGLSRPHFFSEFRDELGLTPSIFWNSLRLEAVK
jgi:transcriptional regulator GlxA family with amidase domain